MAARESVDVAYGEGWDPGHRAVLGPVDAGTAAARDAAGKPYVLVLRQPGSSRAVVAEVNRAGYGLWVYDAQGRRFLRAELRRIEADRLFLAYRRAWAYPDDRTPEFAAEAGRVTTEVTPEGLCKQIVEPHGDEGGADHTVVDLPEERRLFPVPRFGRWAGLLTPLGIDGAARLEFRHARVA